MVVDEVVPPEHNPIPIVPYDAADLAFSHNGQPGMRIFAGEEDGTFRLQVSDSVVGTCAITYIFEGETAADFDPENRRFGEQNCVVNSDFSTALELKPIEWRTLSFQAPGRLVTRMFLIIRTQGGWREASVTEFTDEFLPPRGKRNQQSNERQQSKESILVRLKKLFHNRSAA